jgi:amino acid permease
MPAIFITLCIFRVITIIDTYFNITPIDFTTIGSWIVIVIWFALIIVTRKTTKEISNLHLDITNLEAETKILKTEAKIQHSEDVRQIAEAARQVAEKARVSAEETRIYAESIRVEIFTKLKSLFEKL